MNQKKWKMALWVIMSMVVAACPQNTTTETPKATSEAEIIKKEIPPKEDGTVGMFLPDFTELVAREGGSVVNIQAAKSPEEVQPNSLDGISKDDPFYEFFKRLVPNDPNMPELEEYENNFGSGVIISEDGYILTNTHVIKDLDKIKVTLNDKREYTAKLVGADDKSDIAVLKIEADKLPAAKIGKPDELKSGEWVVAIGAPFGFDNSVTAGIVSAKGRSLPNENYTPFIQTDVAINQGNSGGPLFNLRGQVIGINSQIYSRNGGFMGISFAIPIDVAMNVAEQLKTTGKVQRGQLGVIIQEVTYDLSQSFGLDKPTGALVAKVLPNSPAQNGGLQVGDIIRSVNGNHVRTSSDLPMTIGALPPEKDVILGVWRKGQELNVIVKLAEMNSDAGNVEFSNNTVPHAHGNFTTFEVAQVGLVLNSNGQQLVINRSSGVAAAAGLRRGDVLSEVAGVPVTDQASLEAALAKANKRIPVLVHRNGNAIFFALTLP